MDILKRRSWETVDYATHVTSEPYPGGHGKDGPGFQTLFGQFRNLSYKYDGALSQLKDDGIPVPGVFFSLQQTHGFQPRTRSPYPLDGEPGQMYWKVYVQFDQLSSNCLEGKTLIDPAVHLYLVTPPSAEKQIVLAALLDGSEEQRKLATLKEDGSSKYFHRKLDKKVNEHLFLCDGKWTVKCLGLNHTLRPQLNVQLFLPGDVDIPRGSHWGGNLKLPSLQRSLSQKVPSASIAVPRKKRPRSGAEQPRTRREAGWDDTGVSTEFSTLEREVSQDDSESFKISSVVTQWQKRQRTESADDVKQADADSGYSDTWSNGVRTPDSLGSGLSSSSATPRGVGRYQENPASSAPTDVRRWLWRTESVTVRDEVAPATPYLGNHTAPALPPGIQAAPFIWNSGQKPLRTFSNDETSFSSSGMSMNWNARRTV